MNEIDSITIKGFKSIASIENLKLRPINVIIGPNGSGKSNFIGAFRFLRAIQDGRLQDYVVASGGARKVLHFGAKTTKRIEITLSFRPGGDRYQIVLAAAGADQLVSMGERVDSPSRSTENFRIGPGLEEAFLSAPVGWSVVEPVRKSIERWRVYHFHDTSAGSPLRQTANINDNRHLRADGANLPAVLYYLREKHKTSYDLIRSAVHSAAPFFDDFVLEPLKLKPSDILLEWRHSGSDAYFDVSSFSDGTLRFIALATSLLQPVSELPSLLLLDEPELGLHPFAITLLASMVKQASITSQILISTQSPNLLDHLEPEDVLVAERVNGGTQLRRLEADKLAVWLEDYSLGQLWEKNEIGGRPSRE